MKQVSTTYLSSYHDHTQLRVLPYVGHIVVGVGLADRDLERPRDKFQYTHRVHLQINSRFYPKARGKRRYQMRSAGWYLDFRLLFPPLFRRCQNRINLEVNTMSILKFVARTLQVSVGSGMKSVPAIMGIVLGMP